MAKRRPNHLTLPTGAESPDAYMQMLEHPLKKTMTRLRSVILRANQSLEEQLKWNAPSYRVGETDLFTFNPRYADRLQIIFHHKEVVRIDSPLLEGDYKNRRIATFRNEADVTKNASELRRAINELVRRIEGC